MGNYTIFQKFNNPRRDRQARNFTTKMFQKFQISNRLPNRYFPKIDFGCPYGIACKIACNRPSDSKDIAKIKKPSENKTHNISPQPPAFVISLFAKRLHCYLGTLGSRGYFFLSNSQEMVYFILSILQEWTTGARVLSWSLACEADKFPLPLLALALQATWSLEQTTCNNDVLLQGMLLSSLKDFYIARKHNTSFISHHYFISELLFKQTCFLQAAMRQRIFP